ncbi:MAG TPA: TlpA disulfide reductase family protein [Pyrinomonadaceae bacterium]|nr:TlpA disulfide reductase family protein [Pyrinomonadaceae bacterium]
MVTSKLENFRNSFRETFHYYLIFALCLLGVSACLNGLLAVQLRKANAKLAKTEAESSLQIGETVRELEALTVLGEQTRISLADGQQSLVYIFSPSCGWCQRNLKNVEALYRQKSEDYRFIGISVTADGLEEFMEREKWNFTVIRDVSSSTRNSLKMGGTPYTVVLDGKGQIVKVWRGAYMQEIKGEIEDFFDIRLPGIPVS